MQWLVSATMLLNIGYGLAQASAPAPGDAPNCGVSSGGIDCQDTMLPCCSSFGHCGNSLLHCGEGCQVAFGQCGNTTSLASNSTSNSSSNATAAQNAIGGRCGKDPINGTMYGKCQISSYCCSPWGFCGTGDDYCVGCQKSGGYCPKQCDENSKFCGPGSVATFTIAIISLLVALVGAIKAFWPSPVTAHVKMSPVQSAALSSEAVHV